MRYSQVEPAVFLARPNRFLADVAQGDRVLRVHVKNTGRCRELLVPGAQVWIAPADDPRRKTPADLVTVQTQDGRLVNIDSMAPNAAAGEYLASRFSLVRPETRVGDSRFDFYAERGEERWLIEVKGCTLDRGGTALFPDAPTARGRRHLQELAALQSQGMRCALLVVIAMKGPRVFSPNRGTDPAFADALTAAVQAGVAVSAVDCLVRPDGMEIDGPVPVSLL